LTYVNAGHPRPVLFSAGAEPRLCCEPTGPLVGVSSTGEMGPFDQATLTLQPGEGLLLYTDGVTDSRRSDDIMFGESRLLKSVRQAGSAQTACGSVVEAAMTYQNHQPADDVTVLALWRAGE
jgi:sigma-B regulation protein RsbU (phosphoserine phosphatase)